MSTAASIYLHFPFCETKCHYCDFYSIADARVKNEEKQAFADALQHEAERLRPQIAPTIETLFFGGGTPSMTAPEVMEKMLDPVLHHHVLAPNYEWTMEMNPSSVDPNRLRAYRALGVNRVSMGVQALEDPLLSKLGRIHSRDRALRALNEIFEAGFSNVSVDLLCGVPGQSLLDLETAMATLTAFPITHLSCYLLTLPPHHPMAKSLPDDETQLNHLLLIHDFMVAKNFEHYEISNFCKPGMRAQHNLNYWTGKSYLGLGPSAHSFSGFQKKRWKNFSSLKKYCSMLQTHQSPVEWEELLTPEQQELEKWLLRLRLADGFSKTWLKSDQQQHRAQHLLVRGILEPHPHHKENLRLTPRGFALSDSVVRELAID